MQPVVVEEDLVEEVVRLLGADQVVRELGKLAQVVSAMKMHTCVIPRKTSKKNKTDLVTTEPFPKKTLGCGGTFRSALPYLSLILLRCRCSSVYLRTTYDIDLETYFTD